MKSPYSDFLKEDLILRDHLAIDRTILANESTGLAYIRTSLAVIAAGATLIHFFTEIWMKGFGIFLLAFGLVIVIIGTIRYRQMKKMINDIQRT